MLTNNKVYIVYVSNGPYNDDFMTVYAVRSTKELANIASMNLKIKIRKIKNEYKKECGFDYDSDLKKYQNSFGNEDEDEDLSDRIILYRAKHNILRYERIFIEKIYFK